jgi:hypothetical protein
MDDIIKRLDEQDRKLDAIKRTKIAVITSRSSGTE